MTSTDAIKWLENLKKDIGNPAHQSLWHYEQALTEIIDLLADRKDEPQTDCNGCKFVGTYDTEFPCANCIRKTKDYYAKDEPQTKHKCRRCLYYDISSDYYPCSECVDYSNYTGEVENEQQTERSER